ncbi:MAG: hypothetical protein E6J14_10220 [Chloroflexi bacterium]|nr:MAG: hypothetical protein E6J14_10220 [Chloroflexota bacterium]
MIRRGGPVVALLALMAGFGLGVYHLFGLFRTETTKAAAAPSETRPLIALPGTLYLAQQGVIYRLRDGSFARFTRDARSWSQPALSPDDHLVAVARSSQSSDLYLLDGSGAVAGQITHNAGSGRDITTNHWAFYPHVGADGMRVYFAYDAPKDRQQTYRVDFAIWSDAVTGAAAQLRQLSTPNDYTGGDVSPIPLASGGLLYVRYGVDAQEHIVSRIVRRSPNGLLTPLTTEAEDCSAPALSPDATTLAMVCSGSRSQTAKLEVATFDGVTLGQRRVLIGDQLCAVPAWSPDGRGLAYLAPATTGGRFQLWWLAGATTPAPPPRQQVTENLDFDATSAPAWSGS